jgi:hypothetical protein
MAVLISTSLTWHRDVIGSDPEDWFGGDDLQGFVERNDGLSERADGGPTFFNDQ